MCIWIGNFWSIRLKGDFHLLSSVLKERIAYKRAISEGLGITEYSDSKAKGEFENFFSEFIKAVKMPIKSK